MSCILDFSFWQQLVLSRPDTKQNQSQRLALILLKKIKPDTSIFFFLPLVHLIF